MDRELCSLPLDKLILTLLDKAGFLVVGDIVDFKAFELSKELDIGSDEALSLLKYLKEDVLNKPNTFLTSANISSGVELLRKEKQHVITFSSSLDDLLDGGIPLGKVTEICGPPGIGKTQLCMQLAIDVQIPCLCDGLQGEALYIDTEGSFMVERVVEMARATVLHCQSIAQELNISSEDEESLKEFHVRNILSKMHFFRCYDYTQLIALLHTLETFLKTHPQVRLIVVDSVAYVFRQDIDDFPLRNRHLSFISQTFSKLCLQFNLAVVLVNHMTMKARKGEAYSFVPALGEAWGHNCTYRLILHWSNGSSSSKDGDNADTNHNNVNRNNMNKNGNRNNNNSNRMFYDNAATDERKALLYKSPSKQDSSAAYQITAAGIRDCLHSGNFRV